MFYNVFETIILSIIFSVLKIKLFYFLGRMGINFHHPGTDNIMALNSKSSCEILYKISSQVYSMLFPVFKLFVIFQTFNECNTDHYFIPVVLQVWCLDQQHKHHLGAGPVGDSDGG